MILPDAQTRSGGNRRLGEEALRDVQDLGPWRRGAAHGVTRVGRHPGTEPCHPRGDFERSRDAAGAARAVDTEGGAVRRRAAARFVADREGTDRGDDAVCQQEETREHPQPTPHDRLIACRSLASL